MFPAEFVVKKRFFMGDNFMSIQDTIRLLRETNRWSQEEMAQRLNMSLNGYAKIERGETKLHLDKLTQIAQLFNIDVVELMAAQHKGLVFFMNEQCDNMGASYYGTVQNHRDSQAEIEKLQLIIQYKNEIIEQKENELASLRKVVALLEQNFPPR